MSLRRRVMGNRYASRLPSGFTEKTCIFSTGYSTFIDTGVVPTDMLITTIDFRLTSDLSAKHSSVLGAYDTSNNKIFLICTNTNLPDFVFQVDTPYMTFTNKDNSRHFAVLNLANRTIIVDGSSARITTSKRVPALPIYVFAANRNDGVVFRKDTKGELYYLKFEDGGATVAEFIPCVRDSDGKAGLFDVVSKTFRSSIGENEFFAR